MPRIHPRDIWQAQAIDKALLALLPVCRDIGSARNELRWLKEHAVAVSQRTGHHSQANLLSGLVRRRALGEPLQYVLGSEYFGALKIKCRQGVLIPRCDILLAYLDSCVVLIVQCVDQKLQHQPAT